MTIITIAQSKIQPTVLECFSILLRPSKLLVGRLKLLNSLLLVSIITFTVVYLAALYYTFNENFLVEQASSKLRELNEEVSSLEFDLQKNSSTLVEDHPEVISSMEKVSFIKYLGEEQNYAISYPSLSP